jgi:hypothetical protein
MSRTSRQISISESPEFVMRRGEIELNHQGVLKVYLVDSGIPTLKDSKAPFDRSLEVVVKDIKQSLESYGWTDASYISYDERTPSMLIILVGNYMICVIYKLEARLTADQRERLIGEFIKHFGLCFKINKNSKSPIPK